jgi:hypothetical protein
MVLVLVLGHELVEGAGVLHLDLEEPRRTHRVLVHEAGIVGERFVHLHDLPVERGDDVGRGLDAFDDDDLVALGDLRLDLGQFDEHHVAQLLRREFRDADDDHVTVVAIGVEPFMIFRELHVSLSVLVSLFSDDSDGRRKGAASR